MRSLPACLPTLFFLLTLAVPAGVKAQAPGFCEGDADCALHYATARDLSQSGELARAIASYKAAYDRKPFPPLLFNIARLYHKAGNLPEAARYYQLYLDAPPDNYPEQRVTARDNLAEVTAAIQPTRPAPAPVPEPRHEVAPLPPKETKNVPLYKRWWLWTAVGGVVVAGVITGATLGAYAAPPSWPEAQPLTPYP